MFTANIDVYKKNGFSVRKKVHQFEVDGWKHDGWAFVGISHSWFSSAYWWTCWPCKAMANRCKSTYTYTEVCIHVSKKDISRISIYKYNIYTYIQIYLQNLNWIILNLVRNSRNQMAAGRGRVSHWNLRPWHEPSSHFGAKNNLSTYLSCQQKGCKLFTPRPLSEALFVQASNPQASLKHTHFSWHLHSWHRQVSSDRNSWISDDKRCTIGSTPEEQTASTDLDVFSKAVARVQL